MQIESVETSAGIVISSEPFRIAGSTSLPILEVTVDVLDGHRRVVDQNTDGERQAAQGHEVDGLAQRIEDDDGRDDRQRNRDRDDQRAAPATQEQQHHQGGQRSGDDRFGHDALDGGAHEYGLVACRR